jgi:hypothetical protein
MTTFVPTNQIIGEYESNKHFNSYKEGLDLEVLREYCMEHGERRVIERGEMLEETGELTRMIDLPYFPNICCPI